MRRRFAVAVLSLWFTGAACSSDSPIDIATANLAGNVAIIAVTPNTFALRTANVQCVTSPCYDYSIRVVGKVFAETEPGGGYEEVPFSAIYSGAQVLVWTWGPVAESYPAQAEARMVVIRYQDLFTRKVRSLH